MDIYRKEIRIRSTDTDMQRRLRLSALFTYMQESAISHTTELGAGREVTLDRGLLWIVVQQQVNIRRLPFYDEKLVLSSWPGRTMHLFFPRFWELADMNGETLLTASSLWGLMDQKTRSLAFPEDYNVTVPDMSGGKTLSFPGRIKAQDAPVTGTFTVPYSFIDLNGHMNNARYYDLAMDHLPDQFRERPLKQISVEYRGEASWHDTLTLYAAENGNSWYFAGDTLHPAFRMLLTFE